MITKTLSNRKNNSGNEATRRNSIRGIRHIRILLLCLALILTPFFGVPSHAEEADETIDEILNAPGGTLHFTYSNAEPEEYNGEMAMGFTVAKGGIIKTTVSLDHDAYLSFYTGRNDRHKMYIRINNGALDQVNGLSGYKQHAYQLPAGTYEIQWVTNYPGYSPGVPNPVLRDIKISDTPEGFVPSKLEINEAIVDLAPGGEDTFTFKVYPAFLQIMDKTVTSSNPDAIQITEIGTDTITVKGLSVGGANVTIDIGGVTATIPVQVTEPVTPVTPQSDHDVPSDTAITAEVQMDGAQSASLYSYKEVIVDADLDHAYFYKLNNLYRYRIAENQWESTPILSLSKDIKAHAVSGNMIYLAEAAKNGTFHVTGYDTRTQSVTYEHDFSTDYGSPDYGFAADSLRNFYFSTGLDLYTLDAEGNVKSSEIHSTGETNHNVNAYYIDCLSPDEKLLSIACVDARGSHFKYIDDYPFTNPAEALKMASFFDCIYAFRPVRNGTLLEKDFILNHDRFIGTSGWHFFPGTNMALATNGLLISGEMTKDVGTGMFYQIDYTVAGRSEAGLYYGLPVNPICPSAMRDGMIYAATSDRHILVYDPEEGAVIGSISVDGDVMAIYNTPEGLYALYVKDDSFYYIARLGEMQEKHTVVRNQHITLTYSKEDVRSNYVTAHDWSVNYNNADSVYTTAPSITAPYAAGELTSDVKYEVLTLLNYLRWQYGVNQVGIKDNYMTRSQKGAVLMAADEYLDHMPYRAPDMDDDFFNEARRGLGADSTYSTNISCGETLTQSMDGFVADTNNVDGGIGHRLSLLSPKADLTSFGCANSYNAVSMYNSYNPDSLGNHEEFYAWPSAGYFPAEEVYRGMEWHVATAWHHDEGVKLVFTHKGIDYEAERTSYDGTHKAFGYALPNALYQALTLNGESSKILDGEEVTVTLSGLTDDLGNDIVVTYPIRFFQVTPAAIRHTIETVTGKAATCEETGLTDGAICSGCGAVITEQTIIPALGHDPVTDKGYAATCEEDGLTNGSHCSRCNKVLSEQKTISAEGHSPVTDKGYAATCTEEGLNDGSHCSKCNKVLTEQTSIPVLGHEYINCTEHNELTHTVSCSRCNSVITEEHTWEVAEVITPATELSSGAALLRCPVCGEEKTDILPELDPDFWPFTDVPKYSKSGKENWRYPYVKYAYLKGLIKGDDDKDGDGYTTFRPNDNIRRGDFVLILYRMAGEPEVNLEENPFTDVKPSNYDYAAILWAAQQGIVIGYPDGTFGRTKNITREEIAKVLCEYARMAGRDVSQTSDISTLLDANVFKLNSKKPRWSAEYISWAYAIEMLSGYPEKDGAGNIIGYSVKPKQNATRAEAAKMLTVFCETYGFPEEEGQ